MVQQVYFNLSLNLKVSSAQFASSPFHTHYLPISAALLSLVHKGNVFFQSRNCCELKHSFLCVCGLKTLIYFLYLQPRLINCPLIEFAVNDDLI